MMDKFSRFRKNENNTEISLFQIYSLKFHESIVK